MAEVRREIDRLADVLIEAATSGSRDDIGEVREIICLLTGGRIDLS